MVILIDSTHLKRRFTYKQLSLHPQFFYILFPLPTFSHTVKNQCEQWNKMNGQVVKI